MDFKREWRRNKKVFAAILTIALPAIADLFVQTLLGFFDMVMVGRLGPVAISSVGVGNAPVQAVIPVFFAISIGTTAIVSRAFGSNNTKEGRNSMAQSVILSIPISILITALLLIFEGSILKLVGRANDMNMEMTAQYYQAVVLGLPFLCFNVVFFAAYRSINKASLPMISNIISVISNVILNYLFIFTLGMGVLGAGIATTISRGIITVFFVYLTFFTDNFWVSLPIKSLKTDKEMIKRILKVGIPAAIEQGIFRIGMLVFEMMVISLGTIAYTSHKIALTAESFSFNMGFGFAVAGTALVGQQLGKNSPKNAQMSVNRATEEDCALTVYATIISHPREDLFICDAGAKCLGLDQGAHGNTSIVGFGKVIEHPEIIVAGLSEEVGKLHVHGETNLKIGDKIEIIPNHSCSTANLCSYYTIIEDDEVVGSIPVDVRGNSFKRI